MACTGECKSSWLGTPPDWGLPEKFDRWRPTQEEAISRGLGSDARFIAQVAPTGSGKSLLGVAQGLMNGGRTVFLTSTKGLQDQLADDFASVGLCDVRGKANYDCHGFPGLNCEEGVTAKCHLSLGPGCPAKRAKMRALRSQLVSTNYAYWIADHKYGTGLGKFDFMVMDEAHAAPEELSQAIQVRISANEVEEILGSQFPRDRASLDAWKTWAFKILPKTRDLRDQWYRRLQQGPAKPSWVRTYNHLANMVRKFQVVSCITVKDWVVDETDWGYQFDPIRPARYGESTLFLGVPRILFLSATIRPKTLQLVGASHFDFQEYESTFDPNRFPVYWSPVVRVDHRMTPEMRRLLFTRCDQWIGRRMDRKGLIHTVSHRMRTDLINESSHSRLMMSNYDGDITSEIVERFKRSQAPRLLVSASISTGYDFPYEDAEHQIVLKIPFTDGRSKVMKARQALDREYGSYLAMQQLVQACGRPGRADDDRCETLIPDGHAEWFLWDKRHLAPDWFRVRVRRADVLPPPAPKLEGR